MRTTIIYDNTSIRKDLQANWGFAALVESRGQTILFDTGGSGAILLANMRALNLDPNSLDAVFISHAHFDHIGGLSAILDENRHLNVWLPRSFRGVKNAVRVHSVDNAETLYPGIHSTGELDGIEQSLCVETARGIVIVAGCSHPPLSDIITAAEQFGPVHGIIGGLHGNPPESVQDLSLICATHCTRYTREINALYPDRCVAGGAGAVIDVPDASLES